MTPTLRMPETALISGIAALATWVTLLAWSPFSERPSTYLTPLLGTCLLVALSGALLRAARLPALLVLLAQLVLVGLVLHHSWVGPHGSVGGWLPTPASIAELGAMLSAAVDASRAYPAPVPKGVTEFAPLLVVAGTAVALLVDLVACGLRRAPVAGLPLLAVYTAPVSILDGGVSWLKFAVAGVCFLFLLTCQEEWRLARWGRQVTDSGRVYFDTQETQVNSWAVWSSARKIGFTTTGLAVMVPLVVPTLTLSVFDGIGPGDGSGGSSVTLRNPIVNMRRDLVQGRDLDLLRVTTEDPDPSYLRVTVLDEFDGDTWKPSGRSIPVEQQADGLVPRPPGLDPRVPRTTYPWTVEAADTFLSTWLPAPYPVFSLTAPGDWRYDRDTLDFVSARDDQVVAGMRYDLEHIALNPTVNQLAFAGAAPADVFGPHTEVPDSVPGSVRVLARSVTSGSASKFAMAQALQRWFRVDGGFDYSLAPSAGNGVDDLVRFLEDTPDGRVGYCEQFAASMALMGRTLAIPSRVAVGFLRPEPVGDGSFVFSAHDLHAWPEMYFEGVGWVRFEPTPGSRSGTPPAYTEQRVDRTSPTSSASASASGTSGPNRADRTPTPAGGGAGPGDGSRWDTASVLAGAGGMLALLALLALPRLVRIWVRSRRWAAVGSAAALAEAAWAELRDSALDLGVAWDDGVTVRSQARELVRAFARPGEPEDALARVTPRGAGMNPEAEAALTQVVGLVERARYAPTLPTGPVEDGIVRDDVRRCVEALVAGAGKRRRTRAIWWPASLWARWGSGEAGSRRSAEAGLGAPGVDHAV